jgi:hypothetical protein
MKTARVLPGTFLDRTDEADVRDAVESVRGTTMADRARVLESLCRMAAEQVAQHSDPQRVLDWQDPCSAETDAVLERLRARRRSVQGTTSL